MKGKTLEFQQRNLNVTHSGKILQERKHILFVSEIRSGEIRFQIVAKSPCETCPPGSRSNSNSNSSNSQ